MYKNCTSDFITKTLKSRLGIILDRIRMTCQTIFMHITGFMATELRWHSSCTLYMEIRTFLFYFLANDRLPNQYQNWSSDFFSMCLESRLRIILDRIRETCYTILMQITGFEVTELRRHATCTLVHAHRNIFWLFWSNACVAKTLPELHFRHHSQY